MAINDISQYFTLDNGTQIANDNTFASLAANTRIKNKNSGSTFIKNSNYSNVFDRVSTFAEFIKATDFNIKSSGSGNAVASISYTPSTRTVTQTLTTFATPAQLNTASNNLKSQAVGSISVSGRTVTYKNINGQTLGSFQTQDNNTTYSAGRGLSLNGTEMGHSMDHGRAHDFEGIGNIRLSGNTLIIPSGKITFDRYGHMSGLNGQDKSIDLSSITTKNNITAANAGVGQFKVGMIRSCFCIYGGSILPGDLVNGSWLIYGNHEFQVEDDDKQWSLCSYFGEHRTFCELHQAISNGWTLPSNTTWTALAPCHGQDYGSTHGLFMCVDVRQ